MTATLQRVCVYCASNDGVRPEYLEAARQLGTLIAQRGSALVYGGGGSGLMGTLADATLAAGGEVIGVMPHALVQREAAHRGLTALHVVDSMHERKALLAEMADAFVALPGGLGTLEELFETWTWAQLGVHHKPVGLLNVAQYWQSLVTMLEHMEAEGFLRGTPREWLVMESDPVRLLDQLETFEPPRVRRWLSLGET
ncbi:MAG: TIGR00730 family Rossman fold protein [Gemmatimonas sp.]